MTFSASQLHQLDEKIHKCFANFDWRRYTFSTGADISHATGAATKLQLTVLQLWRNSAFKPGSYNSEDYNLRFELHHYESGLVRVALRAVYHINSEESINLKREAEPPKVAAVPVVLPSGFNLASAKRALTDPTLLGCAFSWDSTPQSPSFWRAEYSSGKLSNEARLQLEQWIRAATGVAVKGSVSPIPENTDSPRYHRITSLPGVKLIVIEDTLANILVCDDKISRHISDKVYATGTCIIAMTEAQAQALRDAGFTVLNAE